jgi:hypothetical protein
MDGYGALGYLLGGLVPIGFIYIAIWYFHETKREKIVNGLVYLGLAIYGLIIVFAIIQLFFGYGVYTHRFGPGFTSIAIINDNGKWIDLHDGLDYHMIAIPYVTKPMKFKVFLDDTGQIEANYNLTGVSRDGISLNVFVKTVYMVDIRHGKDYQIEAKDILNLVKEWGWDWEEKMSRELFDEEMMNVFSTHDAESLVRNGYSREHVPFYNDKYEVYTLGSYKYQDEERTHQLYEKIDRENIAPYQGLINEWDKKLDNDY